MHMPAPVFSLMVATALLCCAPALTAATFSVGPASDCTHGSLQGALDSAADNSGADVVRIVRTATWTGIQVSTDTDQDVEIVGGWASCTSDAPSGMTTLDGAGGQARSVIALRGNGDFTLRNLEITGGDQAGDDDGGGIHFQGGGVLRVVDSSITGNSADEGGGLYAHGTTIAAEAILENTAVSYNTARSHGGGAVAQALEMTILGAESALVFNTSGGSGGGLLVRSGTYKSLAYIGGGLFGVTGNSAARGGGIAVVAGVESGQDAQVQLFSTVSDVPLLVSNNSATERGGGIDLQPDGEGFSGEENADAVANLRHVRIEGNTAPVGAAINLAHDNWSFGELAIGARVQFNTGAVMHPAAAPCPFGKPCGYIRGNTTNNITGAVVHLSASADFFASRIAIEGNQGGWMMYLSGEEATRLHLDNCLIAGNTLQHALIRDDQNEDDTFQLVQLHYLTIADNTLGANGVLSINEDMSFTRSVVDQPGKAMIATDVGATGGAHDIQHVIANTTTSPGGTTHAAPRFVDPANGDYIPRAGSRAVDFAPPAAAFAQDLHSHTRTLDLPVNPNESGPSDAGALEREYLQPLVLNGDFENDPDHWDALATSTWDGTQNASGGPGSGSLRGSIAVDATRQAVRRQCIHLPGPGTYYLNGWGRVTQGMPSHRAWLDWELRYSTATVDGCTDSSPALTGSLALASSDDWSRPQVPAAIEVEPGVWGPYTSLTVYLVVQNGSPIGPGPHAPDVTLGGPDGWFDGITLETSFDDVIFRDGFD